MDWVTSKIFVGVVFAIGLVVVAVTADIRLPGNHRGYTPGQPIEFSHRLHAGELGIDCTFCHYGARKSRTAGIPPASLCMTCHTDVTASFNALLQERMTAKDEGREPKRILSPEIEKIYTALGMGIDGKPDPSLPPTPIQWNRVHHLADFVYFDHSIHVSRGLACQSCHGPVQTMDRLRQDSSFSMGFCLDCHRSTPRLSGPSSALAEVDRPQTDLDHVSTDCASCHY